MSPVEDLDLAALAAGWKSRTPKMNAIITDARSFTRQDLPGVDVTVVQWPTRFGFHGQLVVCGIERGTFNDPADVRMLLEEPDRIGPRCREERCAFPAKEEGGLCLAHLMPPDPEVGS